jgi:hypothetical protein
VPGSAWSPGRDGSAHYIGSARRKARGPTRHPSRTIPRDQHPYSARARSSVGPGQAGPGAVHGSAGPSRGPGAAHVASRYLSAGRRPGKPARYPHGVSPARAARGQPGARSNDGAWNLRGSHRPARGLGFEKHDISSRPPPRPLLLISPPPSPTSTSQSLPLRRLRCHSQRTRSAAALGQLTFPVPLGSPARRDLGWAHGADAVGWCSALLSTVRPGPAVKPGSANSSRGLCRAPCPSWRALNGAPSARAADSAPLVLPRLTGASSPGGHIGGVVHSVNINYCTF